MDEITKYDLIERFLRNELSQEELTSFNARLNSEPAFAQEVREHQVVEEMIFQHGIMQMKQSLNKIHASNTFSGKIGKIGIGSIAAVTVGVGLVLLLNNKKPVTLPSVPEETNIVLLQDSTPVDKNEIADNSTIRVQENSSEATREEINDNFQEVMPEKNVSDKQKGKAEKKRDSVIQKQEQTSSLEVETIEVVEQTKPCENITITAVIKTKKSCRNKATGSLTISSIKGGEAPYLVAVNESGYSPVYTFEELAAGAYNIQILDNNNCEKVYNQVVIESKLCEEEYKFAPEFDQLFTFPSNPNLSGNIRITNRTGQIVYLGLIFQGGANEWNGRDINGQDLPMGSYHFIIEYKDGSIESGYISIIR